MAANGMNAATAAAIRDVVARINSGNSGVTRSVPTRPTISTNNLEQKIAAILSSNAPDASKQAALKNAPQAKPQEAWWQKSLNVIGKPKTLAVAGLRSLLDPNADFATDVRNNVGFGKLVEKAPLPDFVKGLIGFAGDVALDPLTYLGVGFADDALKAGGKGAKLFFEAAKYSDEVGDAASALKFAQAGQKAVKGLSGLSGAERKVLQELAVSEAQRVGGAALKSQALKQSGGLYWNVPFTGKITNRAASAVGLGPISPRQIQLMGQSDMLSSIPRAVRGTEEFIRKGFVGRAVAPIFNNEGKQALVNLARRGEDPLLAGDAFKALKGAGLSSANRARFIREASTRFHSIMSDLEKAGVNLEDVTRAAGMDENAKARVTEALSAKFGPEAGVRKANQAAEFSRDLRTLYNDLGGFAGSSFELPLYELHSARLRTKEIRDLVGGTDPFRTAGKFDPASFEKAGYKPGETFIDTQLVHPSEHPQGLSVPDQMEEIARANFGEDYVRIFNQDFGEATRAQIESMGNRIRTKSLEKYLLDNNISKNLYEQVETASASKARKALAMVTSRFNVAKMGQLRDQGQVMSLEGQLRDAEARVAGTPEQMAVIRNDARIARTTKELFRDPVLRGLRTRLESATSAEQAQATMREMYDDVLRRMSGDDDVLAPFRQAVDELTADIEIGNAAQARLDRFGQEYRAPLKSEVDAAKAEIAKGIEARKRLPGAKAAYDEALRLNPDHPENILGPYRQAMEEAFTDRRSAAAAGKRFREMLADVEAKSARQLEMHEARIANVSQYRDLLASQARLEELNQRLLAEVNSPTGPNSPEYLATTAEMQDELVRLKRVADFNRENRAFLEAPELMGMKNSKVTRQPASGGIPVNKTIRDVKGKADPIVTTGVGSGKVAAGSRNDPLFRIAKSDTTGTWSRSVESFMYFMRHPDVAEELGLKNFLDDADSYWGLSEARKQAVFDAADRVVRRSDQQYEALKQAIRTRMEQNPGVQLKQTQQELAAIRTRLAELGDDKTVKYLGELEFKLPQATEDGLYFMAQIEDMDSIMKWAKANGFDVKPPNSPDAMVGVSSQGIVSDYLIARAQAIMDEASARGIVDFGDSEIEEIASVLQEMGFDHTFGKPKSRKLKFSRTKAYVNLSRQINDALEEKFPDLVEELSTQWPWKVMDVNHGTGSMGLIVLPAGSGGRNFANADSIAGVHFLSGTTTADDYAREAVKRDFEQFGLRGDPVRVKANLHIKNPKVYGPIDLNLDGWSSDLFDQLPDGEWVGGRARYYGDIIRDGLERGTLNRSIIDTLATSENGDVQRAFWNTVFDTFDDTRDAGESLRAGAAMFSDDVEVLDNVRVRSRYRESYDDWLADGLARDMLSGTAKEETIHPIRHRLETDTIREITKGFNETLKSQGFDGISYVHGRSSGWSVIAIDPTTIDIVDAVGPARARTIRVDGPNGPARLRVEGRKSLAYSMFDARDDFTAMMLRKQEEAELGLRKVREELGGRVDRATADWGSADARWHDARKDLMDLEGRIKAEGEAITAERSVVYEREMYWRKRAETLSASVKRKTMELDAELQSALDARPPLMEALERRRAELGVLRLESDYATAQADLIRSNKEVLTIERAMTELRGEAAERRTIRVIEDGFRQLGMSTQAPDQIVEAVEALVKLRDPNSMNGLLKTFDWVTQAFKSWAIATPGFHFRNFFGGVFNNFLAGVEMTSYKQFRRADRLFLSELERGASREAALATLGKRYGNAIRDAYNVAESSRGFAIPGQIGSTGVDAGIGDTSGSWRQALSAKGRRGFLIDNPATRLNLHASEYVERQLRGTLAFDYALKGHTQDEILDSVYKFHFNYEDLSDAEMNVGRRLFPFYTFTRKNLPLQLEMMIQKPQYYANLGFFKNEMEMYSEPDSLTPAWFNQTFNVRLPFTNPMGERMFTMPQLPPSDLMKLSNPREFLGMLNPIIKLPIEMATQKKLYNNVPFRDGYVYVPSTWEKLGIGKILEMSGRAERDADGNLVMRDSDSYAIESFIPLLARTRRLFPSDSQESEKKFSNRVALSWANVIFGFGLTANTESDQVGEMIRRSKAVDAINKDLQTRGFGGYKTMSKDVALKRKPSTKERAPYVMIREPRGGLPYKSSYSMPRKGQNGNEALKAAVRRIDSSSMSPELQKVIAAIKKKGGAS